MHSCKSIFPFCAPNFINSSKNQWRTLNFYTYKALKMTEFFLPKKCIVLQLTVLWGSMILWTDELYIFASTDTEHWACKLKVLSLKVCCRHSVTALSYETDLAADNFFMFLNTVFWFNEEFNQVCDELQLPLYTSYKVNIFFQSSTIAWSQQKDVHTTLQYVGIL